MLTFKNKHEKSIGIARPVMVRMQCPTSLRKYGFCGILATIYAAKLPMPTSIDKLEKLLTEIKGVLSMGPSKWGKAAPKHKGAISFPDTIRLLNHYKTCDYELLRTAQDDGAPTLRKWIKSVSANTCYIIHVNRHALFVEVGAVKSKWRVYDQGGVHTKENSSFMDKKGGYGKKKLKAVIKITYSETS